MTDARVSWHHAVLGLENGRWVLADNGSTNGTYIGERRADRIEVDGECLIRLGDPADGPLLSCTVSGAARSRPPSLRIGRAPDNDIVVADLSVSSYHAELRNVAGGYRIVDRDSRNGTFVNEQQVTAALLAEGDIVGLGDATFRLVGRELQPFVLPGVCAPETPPPAAASPGAGASASVSVSDDGGPLEIRTRCAGWCPGESGSRTLTS